MNEHKIIWCMLSWKAKAVLLLEKIRLFKIRLFKIRLFKIRLFKIDCDRIQKNLKVEILTIFLIELKFNKMRELFDFFRFWYDVCENYKIHYFYFYF